MPKISIIVPVYNVEKYLECCIESILQQKFKDYEIILVDDGSKDSSGSLCDRYSKKYQFIHTIHKENGGLSDARNVGIENAKGDYILFIDSDDYIGINSLTEINHTLDEDVDVDVVFLEAIKVFKDGRTIPLGDSYKKEFIYCKTQKEVINHLTDLPKFPGSACTKLIKRSLINSYELYFQKGLLSEDIDWTIRLLLAAKRFNCCQCNYYYYRQQREGSITNTVKIKNIESLMYIIKKWSSNSQQQLTTEFQDQINMFMAYEYVIILAYYGLLKKEVNESVKIEIKEYAWLLSFNRNRKGKIINVAYNIIGINAISKVLGIYLKYRSS